MNHKSTVFIGLISFLLIGCNQKVSKVDFSLTDLGQNVEFHTELQLKYINAEDYSTTFGIASGSSEKSAPNAVTLSWEAKTNSKKECDSYKVYVFEDNEKNKWTYETKEKQLDVYNLKINTNYHYQVVGIANGKEFTSDISNFKTTSKMPRNLNIENVMNARDLGGNGIKQGLIFRSGRFNETDGKSELTDASKDVLLNQLKIKTEIDLRRYEENGNISTSPIGETVTYKHLPMHYGGNNVLTFVGESGGVIYNNPEQIKLFFDLLADKKNYPVSFHCSIGKDRTGCMAYLIEALCGMEKEFLYRDYLFSNFAKISGMCEITDIDTKYGETISSYVGDNMAEKTFNYLHEVVGVSENNLNSIINILKA